MATDNTVVAEDQAFEDAFKEAATAAETKVQEKPEPKEVVAPTETDAEKKAREETEAKAAAEAKAKEEADAKAAAEAKARENETAEQKAAREKAEAEAKAKQEAEAKAAEETKAREAAEAKVRLEVETRAAAEAKVKAEAEAKAKAEADAKARAEALKPYEPTEEEKKALAKFKEEFPSEFVAMEARMKGTDREIQRQVHAAVTEAMKQVSAVVSPLAKTVQDEAQQRHENAIYGAHKDYDTVIANVPAWIAKQPAYLKAAYERVYNEGTTQEVIDMVTRYKQDAGIVAPPEKKEEPQPKPGLSQEEIDAGKPVGSRRTAPAPKGGEPDKNDFDGAFDEAVKEQQK